MERKILPTPILYLSAFFEATRNDYYSRLLAVSEKGDWHGWLLYFLNGVAWQSKDILERAGQLNQRLGDWRLKAAGFNSKLPVLIVDHLGGNPFLTAQDVQKSFNVAFSTAQRAIDKLEDLGFIKSRGTAKRNRIYCAEEILTIIRQPAKLELQNYLE